MQLPSRISLEEAARITGYPFHRFRNNLKLVNELDLQPRKKGRWGMHATVDRKQLETHIANQRDFAHLAAIPDSEYISRQEAAALLNLTPNSNILQQTIPESGKVRTFVLYPPKNRKPMHYFHKKDLLKVYKSEIEKTQKSTRKTRLENKLKIMELKEKHAELARLLKQMEEQKPRLDPVLQLKAADAIRQIEKTAQVVPESQTLLSRVYWLSRKYDEIVAARALANAEKWLAEKKEEMKIKE